MTIIEFEILSLFGFATAQITKAKEDDGDLYIPRLCDR